MRDAARRETTARGLCLAVRAIPPRASDRCGVCGVRLAFDDGDTRVAALCMGDVVLLDVCAACVAHTCGYAEFLRLLPPIPLW